MGPDCHTASLFPGEPMIDNTTDIIGHVWVEKFKQWRITMLPGVIRAAKNTVMLVTGKDKTQRLKEILSSPIDLKKYPVQMTSRYSQRHLDPRRGRRRAGIAERGDSSFKTRAASDLSQRGPQVVPSPGTFFLLTRYSSFRSSGTSNPRGSPSLDHALILG
jgi:hypothetical protein